MLQHVRTSEGWDQKGLGAKGFTLIELLVVIIILGILAAVVVLAINGIQDRGEENACKTEKKTIETAAAAYYAENGEVWPEDSAALLEAELIRDPAYTWSINAAGEATATATTSGTGSVPDGCN